MLRRLVGLLRRRIAPAAPRPPSRSPGRGRPGAGVAPPAAPGQARAYTGPVTIAYEPNPDSEPDPGEVVWTWVPYEEDASVGKDRPVVVIGRAADGDDLAVVMLSSKDHQGDGRWLVLGSGAWDAADRVSSARLDRVLAVAPGAVRREGSVLERDRFDRLVAGLRALHGWR